MNIQVMKSLLKRPDFFFLPKKYIFIISHMRSNSSVLSHILGSHNAISGYSESHFTYKDRISLMRLKLYIYNSYNGIVSGQWLLDKILNDYEISEKFLNSNKFHFIVLLRKPERTLKSIINMANKFDYLKNLTDERNALKYYRLRLEQIQTLSRKAKNIAFLESESILEKKIETFNNITQWLKLERPLSENYRIFRYTGQDGRGDPVGKIFNGKITGKKANYDDIYLAQSTLHKAIIIYEETIKKLNNTTNIFNLNP